MGTTGAKTTWYFAEGCTRTGFNTWLCIYNPNSTAANVYIVYYLEAGKTRYCSKSVPPKSRQTVDVGYTCQGEHDVASQVRSDVPIVVERSVYFDHGGYNGGHCSMGAEAPQKDWYFAEGCTQPGFQEWLCILNPNNYGVSVNVSYLIEGSSSPTSETLNIPALARYTRNVPDLLGVGKNVSVKISGITAGDLTVCERPIYFIYQGKWNGGHIAMGVNQLSKTWLFAEGCTRAGFETWLTIQNANNEAATISTTYMTGTGENIQKSYAVPPNTRRTISVGDEIGLDRDVSIAVDSNLPVACERPMYFNYHDKWDGGSDSFGSLSPQTTLLFAEGCSRSNFETWLCIQNPNSQSTDVNVSFHKETGEEQQYPTTIPANTRVTINANDVVGPEHDFSIEVTSKLGVVAERPMYFDYEGKAPTPEAGPEPTPPPTPAPQTYTYDFSGSGNKMTQLFGLQKGITTFDLTYLTKEEYSNFIIWLKNEQGDDIELIANAMDSYKGGRCISVPSDNNYFLNIKASGSWTVHIAQPRPSSAPGVPQTFIGTQDTHSGFFTLGSGVATFSMSYHGDSNFIIWLYNSNGEQLDLVENEIGNRNNDTYGAGVSAGIYILDIQGEGSWSVTVSQ